MLQYFTIQAKFLSRSKYQKSWGGGTLLLISVLHSTDYTYQELICCELQLLGRQSVLKNVDMCR